VETINDRKTKRAHTIAFMSEKYRCVYSIDINGEKLFKFFFQLIRLHMYGINWAKVYRLVATQKQYDAFTDSDNDFLFDLNCGLDMGWTSLGYGRSKIMLVTYSG
jgi:hypothetical protein